MIVYAKPNFWLLHFVVVYKPHVQQECYESSKPKRKVARRSLPATALFD